MSRNTYLVGGRALTGTWTTPPRRGDADGGVPVRYGPHALVRGEGDVMTTEVPFVLRGQPGAVRIDYSPNDEPERVGFASTVLGPDYPPSMARGFPVMSARVSHEGHGYSAMMGWVQVVEYTADGESALIFDVPPQLSDSDVPYFAWGVEPTVFDAPGFSDVRDVHWTADTFLVYTPDGLLTKELRPLVAFSWGYRLNNGVVTIAPLTVDGGHRRWSARVIDFRRRYPAWTFHDDAPANG
jgi:hypothetical protein